MIEVENLTKNYGPLKAVDDVSFSVGKGEILGFLGPNGAGKTTTMRILTCFIPPTSGRAVVAGYDVLEDPIEVRRRIGYMPENVPLYKEMTVYSYLDFVAEVKGVSRRQRRAKVEKVMGDCGIADVGGKLIARLSKGYRQRVGLAQALINDPEVLILDEPTIGLDPRQIIEIRQLIKELGRERTVILSTHILPEVGMVCGRVIIINKGKLVAVDRPENLASKLSSSSSVYMVVDGPEGEVARQLAAADGVISVKQCGRAANGGSSYQVEASKGKDIRKELAALVVRNNWGLLEIRAAGVNLEEIFVELVTEEKEV